MTNSLLVKCSCLIWQAATLLRFDAVFCFQHPMYSALAFFDVVGCQLSDHKLSSCKLKVS